MGETKVVKDVERQLSLLLKALERLSVSFGRIADDAGEQANMADTLYDVVSMLLKDAQDNK